MSEPTVLHVLEAFAGGTERHLLDLVRNARGFEHVLAVPSTHHGRSTATSCERARRHGAAIEYVEMGRAAAGAANLAAVLRLREVIARRRPGIVHCHSSIAGAVGRLAAIGTPAAVVYTPHGLSRNRWVVAVERRLGARTDRLIAVSASERDFAVRHRCVSESRVVVIPNGIRLTPPAPATRSLRADLGIPAGAPLIGCCARLAWQKAPEVFVAAAALVSERVREAHFLLVGSGPLHAPVQRAVSAAALEGRFHLLPALEDAAAALAELDAYVLPSRFEGGPYTPLEAMRAGVPVVVTDVDGNRDTVQAGATGLVVPPDDAAALAGATVALLEDSALSERLVRGAREGLARFDVQQMARATERVYAGLLGERTPGRAPAQALLHAGQVDLRVGAHAAGPREASRPLDSTPR